MIELETRGGERFLLDESGNVVGRNSGPKGWNYSGQWRIVGFKKRHHSHATVSLAEALDGIDVGHGWVVDWDHGTYRLWAHPSDRRVGRLQRISADSREGIAGRIRHSCLTSP